MIRKYIGSSTNQALIKNILYLSRGMDMAVASKWCGWRTPIQVMSWREDRPSQNPPMRIMQFSWHLL